MDSLFDAALTDDQQALLHVMAGPWLKTGNWPLWANVQRWFDFRRKDADAIFHSLPRVGGEVPYASGYGFTIPRRAPIAENDRVSLTVAACLVLPELRGFAEPFVRTLRYMVELYLLRPINYDEVPDVILRSEQLTEHVPGLRPWFVKVLPGVLSNEPSGISSGGVIVANDQWERQVNRPIKDFAGVENVEEYVARTTDMVMAVHDEFVRNLPAAPEPEIVEPELLQPERAAYVDPGLLRELEAAAAKTRWKAHRLLALCRELNDNYAAGNPYASAAMIRAILDHIPRAFGQPDYKTLANTYVFTMNRTDRNHAKKLQDFKDIAHDVMHRPIGTSVPALRMNDLPESVRLSAILHELLTILEKSATTP
ncbi:hypothetical protein [Streptomyces longwoodensis]|uniref:hypothetical protein n=1 Tax=Streptomyces longwoodensis TaxID=68231 RepID=UPI00384EAA36